MASISFEASLDTKKLDEQIKKSNVTVGEWAKNVEKSGGVVDKVFEHTSKTIKQAISEQKTLIKSIEQDVKKLQKAYDDATAGRAKLSASNELRSAKRALAEEQAALASLQKQQIEGNRQIEKSSGGIIEKIGRMALAYVSVQAVVKILKETVLAFFTKSQEGVELLERKISGLKAAVGVLQGEFIKLGKSMVGEKGDEATPWGTRLVNGLRLISTTANFIPGVRKYFDDLAASMNEAGKAAENYTRISQELEDAERAMIVPRAKANAEIVKARLLYADDTKSPEIRIAALEKALELEQKTAEEEVRHQQWVILNIRDQNIELEKRGQLRDEDREKLEIAIAEEINLQKESDQRQVRATNSLAAARKELYDEEKRMAKEALDAIKKEYKGIEDTLAKIDPGKGYSILNRSLIRKGITPATGSEFSKEGPDNFKLASGSVEWYKKMQKAIAENDKVQIDILNEQLDIRNQIVSAAADLVFQIGEQIGLDEKSMALLNAGLNAFTAIATKGAAGIPQAALALLSGIISQIPTSASRFEGQIEHINQLLVEQQRLIDQSEQKGGQAADRQGELDYLNQKAAKEEAEYKRLQLLTKSHLDLLGWRQKKADEAYATWQATNDQIEDSNALLDDFYTGTTASAVADAIVQGFQDGKTSAADFADTFNGFMMSAIDAALRDSLLIDLRPWYEQFKIDMADGLSEDEKAQLKVQYDEIIAKGKADRDALYGVAGISPTSGGIGSKPGLSGQIRAMTETTGSELSGLMRRMADDERQIKDYSLAGINHLVGIEKNTHGSWQELITANVNLNKAVTNLEKISGNTESKYTSAL